MIGRDTHDCNNVFITLQIICLCISSSIEQSVFKIFICAPWFYARNMWNTYLHLHVLYCMILCSLVVSDFVIPCLVSLNDTLFCNRSNMSYCGCESAAVSDFFKGLVPLTSKWQIMLLSNELHRLNIIIEETFLCISTVYSLFRSPSILILYYTKTLKRFSVHLPAKISRVAIFFI